jgi:hypothetical protein
MVENNGLIPNHTVRLQVEALYNRTYTSNCSKNSKALEIKQYVPQHFQTSLKRSTEYGILGSYTSSVSPSELLPCRKIIFA